MKHIFMRRKTALIITGILAVCVIASAAILYSKTDFSLNTDELTISQVLLGNTEVKVDMTALVEELDGQKGSYILGGINRLTITDDTIQIDGGDDEGPAHFVLDMDRALFYRSGDESFYNLDNPEQLYQSVMDLIH